MEPARQRCRGCFELVAVTEIRNNRCPACQPGPDAPKAKVSPAWRVTWRFSKRARPIPKRRKRR